MSESPDTIHGRMKEGAHIAGYSLSRSIENLRWLLEEGRFEQLSAGYRNVNEFLRDISDAFKLLDIKPEERKQIAELVKRLQPQASQRAIADMVGVSTDTVARDLGYKPPVRNQTETHPEQADIVRNQTIFPALPPDDFDPVEIERKQQQREEKKLLRFETNKPLPLAEAVFSVIIGDNSDALPHILQLYLPNGGKIADPTWGQGVFWLKVDRNKYQVLGTDIENKIGAKRQADFRSLPYEDGEFDAVVFDPPYKLTGTPEEKDRYGNEPGGWRDVHGYYESGMAEGYRILADDGLLIVKCMDQVVSGKQTWFHRVIFDIALELSMIAEDLFILVRSSPTPQPHERQIHAWKNHSYFWVFRKEKTNGKLSDFSQ